jgi:DNA mismatch endonuclease, patch repair protein
VSRDPAVTSRIMRAIRNRDTKPEMTLRRELHRRGLRYRVRSRVLGHPDIVFPTTKVAVFVDGDYWHGNTWRLRSAPSLEDYFASRANSSFWLNKIRANIARDEHVTRILSLAGWDVIRVWESDLVVDAIACADHVERRVRFRAAAGALPL